MSERHVTYNGIGEGIAGAQRNNPILPIQLNILKRITIKKTKAAQG
jgi:hypothetical protein